MTGSLVMALLFESIGLAAQFRPDPTMPNGLFITKLPPTWFESGLDPFPSAQRGHVVAALQVWTGDFGLAQEGFDHVPSEVGSSSAASVVIHWASHSKFTSECPPPLRYACTVPIQSGGGIGKMRIYFDKSETFSPLPPSEGPSNPPLALVAAHEWGHAFGLQHEDSVLSIMNSQQWRGGDPNRMLRANADEYAAMEFFFPSGGGALPNLMIYGFKWLGGGASEEIWQDSASVGFWSMDAGECHSSGDPYQECCADMNDAPYLVNNGQSSLSDVDVRYYYTDSADPEDCALGIPIGDMVYSLPVGTTTVAELDFSLIDNGMPIGACPDYPFEPCPEVAYRLCAIIDPDDEVAESSEDDNVFVSDFDLMMVSGPVTQCS